MIEKPAACVFDLDGTLVDNMHLHQRSFDWFVERHGLPPITRELRARLDGKRNRDIFPVLFGRALEGEELKAFSREKETYYRECSKGDLRPMPGLLPFLDSLESKRFKIGIATSAPLENVEHSLAELELTGRFPVIVRSDQVPRGKPSPDVFEECARQLGVTPAQCVAFEDAMPGVEAATSAGMPCVALTTTFSKQTFQEHGKACVIVGDYVEFSVLATGWFA